jgi:hypothetical protein
LLAVGLALFGMAVAASGAHASPLCEAGESGQIGSPACALASSLPPGVDSESLYDSDPAPLTYHHAGDSGSAIVLPAQSSSAQPIASSDVLMALDWSMAEHD